MRGAHRVLAGKPEGKRPLGRASRRWEDIKMVFMKWDEGAWSGLIWLRTPKGKWALVNAVMKLRVP